VGDKSSSWGTPWSIKMHISPIHPNPNNRTSHSFFASSQLSMCFDKNARVAREINCGKNASSWGILSRTNEFHRCSHGVINDTSKRQYSDNNCNEVTQINSRVSQSYNNKNVSFTYSTYMQKSPPNLFPSDVVRKPSPNTFPSDAARKVPPNSLSSDAARRAPPNSLPSDAMKNYYATCQAVDRNCYNESCF